MPSSRNRMKKVLKLLFRDGSRCHLCGRVRPIKQLTLDHIIPKSQGGLGTLSNLKLACMKCNTCRNDLPVEAARQLIATKQQQS